MDNAFEDIKRIYTNRYRECKGKVLAKDLNDFSNKISGAIMNALNKTDFGQSLVDDLLGESLRKNPNLTPGEWSVIKARLMIFLFHLIMEECPVLKHEYALHTYDALRKETANDTAPEKD